MGNLLKYRIQNTEYQKSEVAVLDESNKLHADLPFAVLTKETNTFRFLSMCDYAKCMNADNAEIYQKRSVRISPRLGCNLKRKNCETWAENTVHNISNLKILISLKKEVDAVVSCDNQEKQKITLPRALLTLNVHCELEGEHFFIAKLSYRQLSEIDYNHELSKVEFDLEPAALAEKRTDSLYAPSTPRKQGIILAKLSRRI